VKLFTETIRSSISTKGCFINLAADIEIKVFGKS